MHIRVAPSKSNKLWNGFLLSNGFPGTDATAWFTFVDELVFAIVIVNDFWRAGQFKFSFHSFGLFVFIFICFGRRGCCVGHVCVHSMTSFGAWRCACTPRHCLGSLMKWLLCWRESDDDYYRSIMICAHIHGLPHSRRPFGVRALVSRRLTHSRSILRVGNFLKMDANETECLIRNRAGLHEKNKESSLFVYFVCRKQAKVFALSACMAWEPTRLHFTRAQLLLLMLMPPPHADIVEIAWTNSAAKYANRLENNK